MTSVFEIVTMFLKRVINKLQFLRVKENSNRLEDHIKRLSYKGRRANALALRADEGRG